MMNLRLELFVTDIDNSIDFYQRVLNFTQEAREPNGYTLMTNGSVRFSLNKRRNVPANHPFHVATGERPGQGVEIGLEVDDVEAMYQHVQAQNWPVTTDLHRRPWGQVDFTVTDPDGFFFRITSK